MSRVRWHGFISRQNHLRGISRLVQKEAKVCPVCWSPHFETAKRPGLHPLARFYCKNHRGFFFMPTKNKQIIRK